MNIKNLILTFGKDDLTIIVYKQPYITHTGHMQPSIAMNVTQHKIVNLLRTLCDCFVAIFFVT